MSDFSLRKLFRCRISTSKFIFVELSIVVVVSDTQLIVFCFFVCISLTVDGP